MKGKRTTQNAEKTSGFSCKKKKYKKFINMILGLTFQVTFKKLLAKFWCSIKEECPP